MCQFVPYIHSINGWKYTRHNYYKHILNEYYKSNPNKSANDAYNYLQENIDAYIEIVKSNMKIPWKLSTFNNIWSAMKKNKQEGLKHKAMTRENVSLAMKALNVVFEQLQQ